MNIRSMSNYNDQESGLSAVGEIERFGSNGGAGSILFSLAFNESKHVLKSDIRVLYKIGETLLSISCLK
jgi:hypothetical protein